MQSGIDLAYLIALDSYKAAEKRFEAMDSKIQSALTFGMSVTAFIAVASSALKLTPNVIWFFSGIVVFIVGVILSCVAKHGGTLTVVTPKTLHQKWMKMEEVEFKKTYIYFAGQHLDENAKAINWKHNWLMFSYGVFVLEIACFLISFILST